MNWKHLLAGCAMASSLALGAWSQPAASPTPAATPKLSNEEAGWLQTLNASRGDQEALLAQKVRFRRSAWSGAVVVGYVTDRQVCITGSVILGGRVLTLRKASAEMLQAAGWDQAGAEERHALAQRFIDQVIMALGDEFLRKCPDNFPKDKDKSAFTGPAVLSTGAGGVTVVGWTQEAASGQAVMVFRKTQFVFSPQGELERARMLERVVVEL